MLGLLTRPSNTRKTECGAKLLLRALLVRAAPFALLACGPLAFAQRADYDGSRQVKLKGPVTRVEWTHPHTFFFVDVRDANGTTRNWAVESGNLIDLEKSGWKWDSLHVGDMVTVDGVPLRMTKRQVLAKSVVL